DPGGTVRRVPGGVSGWLAERASGGGSPAAKPRSAAPDRSSVPPRANRTSGPSPSTIGRRLRETEQSMVKAQKRVEQLTAKLASVADHAELTALGTDLASAQAELDDLE